MSEASKRMRQTHEVTGDKWFLIAADEIERLEPVRDELAYILNYFQGGIRPLDLRDWWLRSCEVLKQSLARPQTEAPTSAASEGQNSK